MLFRSAIESRDFHADFRTNAGPSSLDLNGACLAPSLRANWRFADEWSLFGEVAGYAIKQLDRDRDRLDDLKRIGCGVQWQRDGLAFDLAFSQQEADLVEDHGLITESFVHSRLSTLSFGFSLVF